MHVLTMYVMQKITTGPQWEQKLAGPASMNMRDQWNWVWGWVGNNECQQQQLSDECKWGWVSVNEGRWSTAGMSGNRCNTNWEASKIDDGEKQQQQQYQGASGCTQMRGLAWLSENKQAGRPARATTATVVPPLPNLFIWGRGVYLVSMSGSHLTISPPPPVLLKHCNVIVISIIFIINILCTTTGFVRHCTNYSMVCTLIGMGTVWQILTCTVPVTNPIHPQLNHPQSPLHWCPLMHHTKLIIVLPHKLTLCLSRALFMKFFTDLAHLTVSSRWLCAILRQFVPRDPSLLRKRKWEMESKENQIYCKRLSRAILR
jgi:hypothetical protein